MATDATFDNQLQALATATANFANGKDAAIKNTIITALGGSTQSGGSDTFTVTTSDSAPTDYSDYVTVEGGVRLNFVGDRYIDVTWA